VGGRYQAFYDYWRDESASSHLSGMAPYELSLGLDPQNKPLLPFRHRGTSGRIVVTKTFADMLARILALRMKDSDGNSTGVVLTGQPGTGTSMWPGPTPRGNSPVLLSSRKDYLPKVSARVVAFSPPGHDPV